MSDPYLVPGTDCLANKLGIRDPSKLSQAEYARSSARALTLQDALGPSPAFNFDTLKAVHRHLFQDVYTWAGQVRTVDIAKPGAMFAPATQIERYAPKVFADLAKENNLKGLTPEAFAQRAAHHFAEINAVHPFREGNGRANKEFFRLLALEAGHRLDWSRTNPAEYLAASRESFNGTPDRLAAAFRAVLVPSDS
jgi:cell filamentation protein